jgi:isopentenyl-diphosphate delta-isomerase
MRDTEERKRDHISLCLDLGDEAGFAEKTTWLEHVELIHGALPELSWDEISLEASLLGRRFSYPLLIEGMTGGAPEAYEINRSLAEAAERLNIPMGVGSQRAGIENPSLVETYSVARKTAPRCFLIGNLSGVELAAHGISYAERAVEMIEADALAIHLNVLQEIIQPEGSRSFKGILRAIEVLCERLDVPVIVKEVGFGVSREVAERLAKAGVGVIDIAGAGGTNWAKIEGERVRGLNAIKARISELYSEWGIPTAASIMEVSGIRGLEVIASGGIRDGLQAAKAIALGAGFVGMARPLLKPALKGPGHVEKVITWMAEELRVAMLLTGSKTIRDLRKCRYILLGPLREWALQRARRPSRARRRT